MKLASLIAARNILATINTELPFSAALKIARFIQQSEDPNKLFEERRMAIVNEYAVEKDDPRSIPPEKVPEANERLAALGDEEVADITVRFKADELANVTLTPAQAYALLEILED